MNRPPSGGGRRPTGSRQAPPTAMRMPQGTGAPGTGRPGTRGAPQGTGAALDAKLNVLERPTTQQGLGGMRTGKRGPQRVVMDKSYFLGLLRTKINELQSENKMLENGIAQTNEDNDNYLSYEKRAETLANEVKDLQGQLGDYNTLVDKLSTDTAMEEVVEENNELKFLNDAEVKNIEAIFTRRQEMEVNIHQIDTEIQQCRMMADTLVEGMSPQLRQKYASLKQTNEALASSLEDKQQELDALNTKKEGLEEELSQSQVKQEAVQLYEQLRELEEKRSELAEEKQSRGTPAEERARLLGQVREDNQEIATMDRQVQDYHLQINSYQDEIRQLDIDLDDHQGEKNQKYKELKKRDQTMTEFLTTFEETKKQEMEHTATLEGNVVAILSHMSRNMGRTKHLPNPKELARMQDDLSFKQTEMRKSESTAATLAGDSARLQLDLQKMEQLESKIKNELQTLKEHILVMERDMVHYIDLNKLTAESDERKKKLEDEKLILIARKDTFKTDVEALSAEYEAIKTQLSENETNTQLGNLERKWQHHEQNNFVMKEYIATKSMESDYRPLVDNVNNHINDYNKLLQDGLTRGGYR